MKTNEQSNDNRMPTGQAASVGAEQRDLRTAFADLPTNCGEPAETNRDDDSEFPKIEGLVVQKVLGIGGMGIVYRAVNVKLDRVVALKMVHVASDSSTDVAQRFLNEVQSISALQHSNIVQVLSAGDHLGHPYYVMEFIEGQSLEERCKSQPQDPLFAAGIVKTLAITMQYCHERNILHRDLKPSNVMMVDGRHPKITDFGLAKLLGGDQQSTRTGEIVGTPGYMAPEQAGGVTKSMGAECDVYGLGAILYKLLTGRPPFEGPEPVQVVMMLLTDDPVPPSRLQSRVPRDLETICLKCLAKQPSRRYRTATALAEDIDRFLNHRTISARPSGPIEKATKWIVRHPTLAATVASLTLLIAAGAMGLSWHYNRLSKLIEDSKKLVEYSGDLSSWIIFDHLPELRTLSGSTRLQLELVSKIQKYLDDSGRETNPDSVFLRRMGAAYECLADVQGNPYIPNLGRTTESIANYILARQLYRKSLALDASDLKTCAKVAECSIKLAEVTLQTDGIEVSKKWLDEAATIIGQLDEAKYPKAGGLEILLVGSRYSIAVAENKPSDALKLLDQIDSIIETVANWEGSDQGVSHRLNLDSKRGNILMELGRHAEARIVLEGSMEQVIALSKQNPNDFYFQDSRASKGLDLADCLTWLASEKVADGLADEATALYERALDLYRETLNLRERVSKSDPSSAFAKYGIAVALERISTTLQFLHRQSETLEPATRSLQLWEELQALAPNNTDYRRNILIISQLIGDIYWDKKDYRAANVPYQKGLKTVESLVEGDDSTVGDLEAFGQICLRLGRLKVSIWAQKSNEAEADEQTDLAELHEARAFFDQGIKAFDRISEKVALTGRQQRVRELLDRFRKIVLDSEKQMKERGSDEIQ